MDATSTKPSRRKKIFTIFGIVVFLLVLICGSCYFSFSPFGYGICQNQVFQTIPSPDNQYKVIVFQRNCRTTPVYSTQVSILPISKELSNSVGNVLVMDGHPDRTGVKVSWQENRSVTITYLGGFDLSRRKDTYRNWFQVIHVQYKIVSK